MSLAAYYRARADAMRAQSRAYKLSAEAERINRYRIPGQIDHFEHLARSYLDMAGDYDAMAANESTTAQEGNP